MLTIPPTAPFSPEQIGWLNGYLAARVQAMPQGASAAGTGTISAPDLSPPPTGKAITLIWGSQTGTCETLAKSASKKLIAAGHIPSVRDMADLELTDLAEIEHLLILTSTYGDGEPPDNAAALHTELHGDKALDLSKLSYSVLGLGDSEYPEFNQCAKDFDSVLEKLNAKRLIPLIESDVEYEEPFAEWIKSVSAALV